MKGHHLHQCATPNCPHYFYCTSRDCRLDWTCPTCEDNERFEELEQQEQELSRADYR